MRTSTSAIFVALAMLVLGGSRGIAQQAQPVTPDHLGNAKALLQSLPAKDFSSDKDDNDDAADEVAKLRRQFDELVKAFDASPESGTESGWKMKFSDVERTLARIIGGGSTLGPTKAGAAIVVQSTPATKTQTTAPGAVEVPSGGVSTPASNPATATPTTPPNAVPPTAGTVVTTPQNGGTTTTDTATVPVPVGTSGVAAGSSATGTSGTASGAAVATDAAAVAAAKVSTIGIKRLNSDVRRQLEMFRTEIELFYVTPVAERASDHR